MYSLGDPSTAVLAIYIFRSSLVICHGRLMTRELAMLETNTFETEVTSDCPSASIVHLEPLCILKELIWKSHDPDLFFSSHRRKNPVQK